ncbi:PREDICTED: uncharacterized protein LOC106819106 [Priapulus caudatus]|uniref:Uncharacterized protein LOC106819106 n=1 Tax=Priapulus caudatus TaxID=37621 RepID=A0ABM1F482_PRICU|nr:PREDICTED: uncharacterized protein LOC106819106 [Priapulus caudatus]
MCHAVMSNSTGSCSDHDWESWVESIDSISHTYRPSMADELLTNAEFIVRYKTRMSISANQACVGIARGCSTFHQLLEVTSRLISQTRCADRLVGFLKTNKVLPKMVSIVEAVLSSKDAMEQPWVHRLLSHLLEVIRAIVKCEPCCNDKEFTASMLQPSSECCHLVPALLSLCEDTRPQLDSKPKMADASQLDSKPKMADVSQLDSKPKMPPTPAAQAGQQTKMACT